MSTSKSKMLSGKVTKHVSCEKCGRAYQYELSRTVFGKCPIEAATPAEEEAEAIRDAEIKLKITLADGCDVVGCPACGCITQQMKAHRRGSFGASFACTGVGVGILAAVYVLMLLTHKILIFGALGGVACVVLGLVLLLASCTTLIPKKAKF